MKYEWFDNTALLSLAPGEEIIGAVTRFCREQAVRLAAVGGVGAVNKIKIGIFHPGSRQYQACELGGDFEIVSLAGTVTELNGEPYPHLHASFADAESRVLGGHLNLAVVSAACEITLARLSGGVQRRFDPKIGLNLMELDREADCPPPQPAAGRRMNFWKMHGAGNDFILFDDRELKLPVGDQAWIRALCDRRCGIGAEGAIFIQPSCAAAFMMRFFNPDGLEAELCGNGARCVARLAFELGLAPQAMAFETKSGLVRAEVNGGEVSVRLPAPRDWRMNGKIEAGGVEYLCHFVRVGVPHAVVAAEKLPAVDVAGAGRAIRRHAAFAPEGTNVDFFEVLDKDFLAVRTYERGVEAETLACGTGIAACAAVAMRLGLSGTTAKVRCSRGDVLAVKYEPGSPELVLTGPAEFVFKGELCF